MSALTSYTGLVVAAVIVVLGLIVYGFRDLIRLSPRRAWAISGVCFDESIRRRVLWITPLAMLGVILVSQLTKPIDELDAIRQTTKFALFATGLVVTITAIILAATNLPKEIDNRVIYTIVTKPTTRLEIVLGKVIGFARVSATILLIMGVFSYGYLALRAWNMGRYVQARLATADDAVRPTLQHYADHGLLNAREFLPPKDLQFYAALPASDDAPVRWFSETAEQSAYVPFVIDTSRLPQTPEQAAATPPLVIVAAVDFRRAGETAAESPDDAAAAAATRPTTAAAATPPVKIPFLPGMQPDAPVGQEPQLSFEIADANFFTVLAPNYINKGQPLKVTKRNEPVMAVVDSAQLKELVKLAPNGGQVKVHVRLVGAGRGGYQYGLRDGDLRLGFTDGQQFQEVAYASDAADPTRPAPAVFRGRQSSGGQQVRGDSSAAAPVAVYRFRGVTPPATDRATLEFRTRLERSADGSDEAAERPTAVQFQVVGRGTSAGRTSDPVTTYPENDRPTFTSLPTDAMAGGNFDVVVRSTTPGDWVTLTGGGLGLVQADRSFALNLGKSLLVLWLLSVLVITIAIFCSTFLSWPIAIILTIVILLGHWGVQQLGDAATPGIGRQVTTDLGIRDAADARVVSQGVEALTTMLNALSRVLPDISRFNATEFIERGVWMPAGNIAQAVVVLVAFGIPLTVLAYVFLRNKEVAP